MRVDRVTIKNLILCGNRKRSRICSETPRVCKTLRDVLGEKLVLLEKLVCPYCGKQFRYQSRLAHHIRRKHYVDMMADVEEVVELWRSRRR
jgi:uncharacterized C2H2 Zn-finger protein